jgi:hypothetical protein
MHHQRQQMWDQIIAEVQDQYLTLKQDEKNWLDSRLCEIADLQRQLNNLFKAADGEKHCRDCVGGCCHAGHNHMNLVNLLQFVSRHQQLPSADFQQSCPFLGVCGCLLPVERRPYNCISFICDIIENALPPQRLSEFYRVEGELRQLYLAVSQRYLGAAMTGLLLQYMRQQGRSFFELKTDANA